MRTDKKMSVKISDIKVGDKILSSNENETTLQPYINLNYLQRLKKGNTVKTIDTYGKEWV